MSREITKEEEAVIEAAWHGGFGHHPGGPSENCSLCHALDALKAARAMKAKRPSRAPPTAMERVEKMKTWAADGPYSLSVGEGSLLDEIRAAESAAWDRCVEAAAKAARDANDLLDFSVNGAIRALTGRCHEATP